MREIIILIAIIIFVIYLSINQKKSIESYNDYGQCSNTRNETEINNISNAFANAKKVYKLGTVGVDPWGECPGFLDQDANWIWFTPDAEEKAPGAEFGGATFMYNWTNNTQSNIEATINIIVDNESYISVNDTNIGKQSGGFGGKGGLFKVTLQPGLNTFSFNATNLGESANPGGLLVTVVDSNNNKLFSSGDGWKYTREKSLNETITSKELCEKAGGTNYAYCPETKTHYCEGVCGNTATCSSQSGLKYNACQSGSQYGTGSGNTGVCPNNFPYKAFGGKICYTKKEYADNKSGPCESWCTNDENFGSGCGNPAFKLCSDMSVSNEERNCFNLNYMNKRKILIAISYELGENTYENTKNQCLGIIQKNDQSANAYKASTNNVRNEIYSSVFIYTGKRGGLAPDNIYKSCSNDVNFFCKWMPIQYEKYYFIKNLDNGRYLGYGNMNTTTEKDIKGAVYMSPEKDENGKWALSENNLWDIKKIKCNTYTIQHKKTGKYLSSTKPSSRINFVTNVYSDDQPVIKPEYNKYGDVYCDTTCFQWFIVPLPPFRGYWHTTVKSRYPAFLPGDSWYDCGRRYCYYNRTPYPMRPCAPTQLGGKQIPYPWFQAMRGNSGVCLNATGCGYVQNQLIWKRLKITVTIGNGQYDGTKTLDKLYLTNNNKKVTSIKSFTGEDFSKGRSKTVEFMIGLQQPYINGMNITVGNDGVVITKIVLEVYNDGTWQTILSSGQGKVWVKNKSHQYTFDRVTL